VTINRSKVSRPAVKAALQVRARAGFSAIDPVNAFVLAEKLGIEVRFVDIPSMEGMYVAGVDPTIVISSLRPLARQQFTCAHELGHYTLEHGDTIDSLVEQRETGSEENSNEVQADAFASYLLMPPTALDNAFHLRELSVDTAEPRQLYLVANYFGVGFSTLVRHLQFSVKKMNWLRATEVLRRTPRQIRSEILPESESRNLIVIDKFWHDHAVVDCEVGDIVLTPKESQKEEGSCLIPSSKSTKGIAFQAVSPGKTTIRISELVTISVRVARQAYVGRLAHRYTEAIDD
jgi:Zn-dependent peptidase ImmA (M78 family)